jgi:RNA polymerase sigma-70 factor (ECF subfamily)
MTAAERHALLDLVTQGDADALQRLLVEYHAALSARLEKALAPALRRRIEPADVLQEAHVAAFRALQAVGQVPDAPADRVGSQPMPPSRTARSEVGPRRTLRFDNAAAFYGWLERIVLNQLRDAQRAARRKKRDVAREAVANPNRAGSRDAATSYPNLIARLSATGTTPSRALSRQESVAVLMTCLARLPDEQRSAVRWRFLEDLPVAEIARRLGKTETAVYTLYARGLKALRALMEPITQSLTGL